MTPLERFAVVQEITRLVTDEHLPDPLAIDLSSFDNRVALYLSEAADVAAWADRLRVTVEVSARQGRVDAYRLHEAEGALFGLPVRAWAHETAMAVTS